MKINIIHKLTILFLSLIFVPSPLKGQVSFDDSIQIDKYKLDECIRANSAIKNSMPYTAIEIMQNLKKKYTLNYLEYCVLARAYNVTQAYDKTKELYNEANISIIDDDNLLFVMQYIIALSKTEDYREAIALREKVISFLATKDDYNEKSLLAEEYTHMAEDYFFLKEYAIGRKWMDKAISFKLNLLNTDILAVAKEEIDDIELADFFTRYYSLLYIKNPLDKDNDIYLALSVACGNVRAQKYFQSTGKNYKRILKSFIKEVSKQYKE